MPPKPVPYFPPKAVVADWVIKKMHSRIPIREAELWKKVNWSDTRNRHIFNDHRDSALELLRDEGYILLEPGLGAEARYGHKITLTDKGRKIKDAGGYITSAQAKEIKDAFLADVALHDGKKKKWDNQTKYFVFGFSALSAILTVVTLWEKCAPNKKNVDPIAAQQHAVAPDSTASKPRNTPGKDLVALNKKNHHPHSQTTKSSSANPATSNLPGQTANRGAADEAEPKSNHNLTADANTAAPLPGSSPLRIAHADNIEFKLLKATGSKSAQTITLTVVLTSSAANGYIWSRIHSIIDADGNEYLLKSYRIGAGTFEEIPLTTGVPIRCVYTFGGILPSVRTIKLFTFAYGPQHGGSGSVEFRDIFVDWN